MAINTVLAPDGQKTFTVAVSCRSGIDRSTRTSRSRSGVTTLEKAKRLESTFLKECRNEIREMESLGCTWETLIKEWISHNMQLKVDNPNTRMSTSTFNDYISTIEKWTGHLKKQRYQNLDAMDFIKIFDDLDRSRISREHKRRLKRLCNEIFDVGIRVANRTKNRYLRAI